MSTEGVTEGEVFLRVAPQIYRLSVQNVQNNRIDEAVCLHFSAHGTCKMVLVLLKRIVKA